LHIKKKQDDQELEGRFKKISILILDSWTEDKNTADNEVCLRIKSRLMPSLWARSKVTSITEWFRFTPSCNLRLSKAQEQDLNGLRNLTNLFLFSKIELVSLKMIFLTTTRCYYERLSPSPSNVDPETAFKSLSLTISTHSLSYFLPLSNILILSNIILSQHQA